MRGGLSQLRGGAMARAWKHIWLLIFCVLFASRQKGQKRNKVRTPLKAMANLMN
jgi:hypothetical protein